MQRGRANGRRRRRRRGFSPGVNALHGEYSLQLTTRQVFVRPFHPFSTRPQEAEHVSPSRAFLKVDRCGQEAESRLRGESCSPNVGNDKTSSRSDNVINGAKRFPPPDLSFRSRRTGKKRLHSDLSNNDCHCIDVVVVEERPAVPRGLVPPFIGSTERGDSYPSRRTTWSAFYANARRIFISPVSRSAVSRRLCASADDKCGLFR